MHVWTARSRYAAQGFKWQEHRADLFTLGSTTAESRVVDFMALKMGWQTLTVDAEDAYLHTPEAEEVWVEPPPELLEEMQQMGRLHRLRVAAEQAAAWPPSGRP